MSNGAEDQSLSERVEFPTIPQDAAKKISHLQEEFIRAEVEQCEFPIILLAVASRRWRAIENFLPYGGFQSRCLARLMPLMMLCLICSIPMQMLMALSHSAQVGSPPAAPLPEAQRDHQHAQGPG